MRNRTVSHQNSNKENNRNSVNRKARESTGSQHDENLISKLLPDFGLSALTRNISELLDLPERTDLNRGNDGDGTCDIFSSNVIDVVKDLGQEVTKGAQDLSVKTVHDLSKTAHEISKTAHDISKTARAIIPLPTSLVSNSAPVGPPAIKVKAPRNYNVNFIFTEVERSREESFLDLSSDGLNNNDEEDQRNDQCSSSGSIPPDFRTPTKTYEQQDMFNLLYTPATCCSRSSNQQDEEDSLLSPLCQSQPLSPLNQSVVGSAAKSVHSLEDRSPLKLEESVVQEEEEEEVEQCEESDPVDRCSSDEVEDEEERESIEDREGRDDVAVEGPLEVETTEAVEPSEALDTMDVLLQTLFDGEVTPLVCPSVAGSEDRERAAEAEVGVASDAEIESD